MSQGQKISLSDFQYLAFQQTIRQVDYSKWNSVRDALRESFNATYGPSQEYGLHREDYVHSGAKISSRIGAFAAAAQQNIERIGDVKNAEKLVAEIVTALQPYLPAAALKRPA